MPVSEPSRIQIVSTPIFSLAWLGDPGDGTSYVAYAGGGGSSRTGVDNKVCLECNADPEPIVIDTGLFLPLYVHLFTDPATRKRWMLVSVALGSAYEDGSEIRLYELPRCELRGVMQRKDYCVTLSTNSTANQVVLGCMEGSLHVCSLEKESFDILQPLWSNSQKHSESITAVSFSSDDKRLLSSAKDGTACVWSEGGAVFCAVTCDVTDPNKKAEEPKKRKYANANIKKSTAPNVVVRGSAFGDLSGTVFYTVASPRRGTAFLARWQLKDSKYICFHRTAVSPCPISAMSISQDGGLIVLGSCQGQVTLWDTQQWLPLRVFNEVHQLPVPCVAARPFPCRLQGEEDGVEIHARSASADSTIGCLTLQKAAPNLSFGDGDIDCMRWMHRIFVLMFLFYLLSPVFRDAASNCEHDRIPISAFVKCLTSEGIIAPKTHPGIEVPPY